MDNILNLVEAFMTAYQVINQEASPDSRLMIETSEVFAETYIFPVLEKIREGAYKVLNADWILHEDSDIPDKMYDLEFDSAEEFVKTVLEYSMGEKHELQGGK